MVRRKICNKSAYSWAVHLCALVSVLSICTSSVRAVGLNYVDASANPFSPPLNLAGDTFTLTPPNGTGVGDGHWDLRVFGAGGSIYESGGAASETTCAGCTPEGAPEINQTITGLTPGSSYDMYAAFWSADGQNWMQEVGVVSGNLKLYDRNGPVAAAPTAIAATNASSAVWDTPPLANSGTTLYHEGDRSMLLGYAGTVTADGNGQAVVYLNDLPATGTQRSFFDGVAYAPAGTQIALTATINRTTGALTVANPTSGNFQIVSYAISSAAGALNATTWNTISGHTDANGNHSFDTNVWNITAPVTPPASTPFATQLAEAQDAAAGNVGANFAAGAGLFAFGNVWQKSAFQDVTVTFTLTDGSTVTINPQYTGTAIAPTDFNGDGVTNLADFQAMLTNMQTNVASGTKLEAFRRGDTNGDSLVDFNDFSTFRIAYNTAHGAGAFNQLLAQVPEPSGIALLVVFGAISSVIRRRRTAPMLAVLLVATVFSTASRAIDLLDVDIDARSNTTNTAPGYSSLSLPASPTGAVSTGSSTVNGYSFAFTAVDASGLPNGTAKIDDRVRPTPTGTPSLYQIYQDFIFAGTSVGVGGGMNLEVSGGALTPNTAYTVSFYSFDQATTGGRTSQWLDGNNANTLITNVSFNGSTLPTTNTQYKFSGLASTDATGKLLLKGRSTQATATNNVFLNALEIAPVNELTLEVNTITGLTRILDTQPGSFDASYYEVRSSGGSLNPAGWTSLDDADPNPDPIGTGWDEVPASNANILSEVNLTSMSTFTPGSNKSLGNIFTLGGTRDVRFFYSGPNETTLRQGIVRYVTTAVGVPGDYNGNGKVDMADYIRWRDGGPLQNESASPGTVDQADYTYWRSRFGATSGSGSSLGGGSNVPEPIGLALLAVAAVCGTAVTRRRK